MTALGFPIVALSPDRPEKLVESRKASSLGYALYSDSRLEAARAFGITFQVDEQTRARYERAGLDLEDASGQSHGQLPVPSVFLVEAGGRILWVYSNPDYRIRPDNAAILEAARKARR
jgi:peroxiredoxin